MRLCIVILFFLGLGLFTNSGLAQDQIFMGRTLAWSPDGQQLAIADKNNNVLLISLETPNTIVKLKHPYLVSSVSWSPDMTRLATFTSGDGMNYNSLTYIWDITTGDLLKTLQGDSSMDGGYVVWNPRQEILASIAYAGDGGMFTWFWDTETYKPIGSTTWVAPITIKWNPDGTLLAVTDVATGVGSLEIYDTFTSEAAEPKTILNDVWTMDWSPDGTSIAALNYDFLGYRDGNRMKSDSWLTILGAETLHETVQLTKAARNELSYIRWSPDGSRIALLQPDHTKIIDAKSGDLLEQFSMTTENNSYNLAWSPYGGRLAVVALADKNIGTSVSNMPEIQIISPAPSVDLLNHIAQTCVPLFSLIALPPTDDLAAYSDAINKDSSIPPACAADLIAVAEALQTAP